ncbi:MAG: cytochrome c [Acidobacteriota bacterium]|nr:cytochrome c [Acidobacteriota bacterium]
MWKSLLLIAAATSFGLAPVAMNSNAGQAAKHTQKSAAKAEAEQQASANAEAMDKAKKLYEMDCALCHGDKGLGDTDIAKEMKLTLLPYGDPKAVAAMSDQEIFDLIRKGKDKMPPEAQARAKDDEVHDLIKYVRQLAKDNPATAPAAPAAPAEPAQQSPQ